MQRSPGVGPVFDQEAVGVVELGGEACFRPALGEIEIPEHLL